jgi:hypothetical protein
MSKKNQLYLVGAAIVAFFLLRKGTTPPPPPPPITCPLYYHSDGTKCVPDTPAQTQSWSFIVDPNNVSSSSVDMDHTLRVPNGFSGGIVFHDQFTNAHTHEQVAYEIWQQDFTNYGGGYINRRIRIDGLAPATLYNVFSYVTNATVTERLTGLVYKRVQTR